MRRRSPPGSGSTPASPRPPPRRVRKLTRAGLPRRPSRPRRGRSPRLTADEPAFDVFWEASQAPHAGRVRLPPRRRRPRHAPATSSPGASCATRAAGTSSGFDTDRGEERIFRLSRDRRARRAATASAGLLRRPGGHRPPRDGPPAGPARPPHEPVTVLVRQDAGGGLRRAARDGRDRRTRPRRRRLGPAGRCPAAAWPLADELLAYGADVYVESPHELRDAVVERLPGRRRREAPHDAAAHRTRQGPGRPPAGAGAVPPRPRRGRGSTRRPPTSASTPAQIVNDLKVLFMCGLPGGYPDDLIDVDLDALEGEEGDGVIRVSNADYLARPLQLSPHRGVGADRGAARPARRQPPTTPARSSTARWPSSRPRRPGGCDPPRRPRRRPGRRRRRRATAPTLERAAARPAPGPADLLRARRATRRPSGSSTRAAWSPRTASPTSTPGATAPRRRGCSGSTGSGPPRCSTRRSRPRPSAPRDLADGLFHRSPDTTLTTLRLAPAGALGRRSTTRSRTVEELRDGGLDVDLLIADERWLHRLLLRLAPNARVIAPARVRRGVHGQRHRRRSGLYALTRRTMDTRPHTRM